MIKLSTKIITVIMLFCGAVNSHTKPSADLARLQKIMVLKDDTIKVNTFVANLKTTRSFWKYNPAYDKVLVKAFAQMTRLTQQLNFASGDAKIDCLAGDYYGRDNSVKKNLAWDYYNLNPFHQLKT